MVSHKKFGGIELSIGAGGLRFKKRASDFNYRMRKCLLAKGRGGGRSAQKQRFTECAHSVR